MVTCGQITNKIFFNHPLKSVSERSNKRGTSLLPWAPASDSEPCSTAVLHLTSDEKKVPDHSLPVAAAQAPPSQTRPGGQAGPGHQEALPGDTDPSTLRNSFESGSSLASGAGPDAPALQLVLQRLGRGPCCALSLGSAGWMSDLLNEDEPCELTDKPPDAGAAVTEPAEARVGMPARKARRPRVPVLSQSPHLLTELEHVWQR